MQLLMIKQNKAKKTLKNIWKLLSPTAIRSQEKQSDSKTNLVLFLFFVLNGKVYLHNLELHVSTCLKTTLGNIHYLFKCCRGFLFSLVFKEVDGDDEGKIILPIFRCFWCCWYISYTSLTFTEYTTEKVHFDFFDFFAE